MITLQELLEISEPKPLKIYCDLDGVLTDFDGRFKHFSGGISAKDYKNEKGEAEFWKFIDYEIGYRFWAGMDWMENGRELWDYIKQFNPGILTTPSRNNVSRIGKRIWVEENLTPRPDITFAYNKGRYANKHSILIDDRQRNLDGWQANKGIPIRCLYGNITPVLAELKRLGL